MINIEEEKQKLINDKEKVLLEIRRAEQMLQNPGFALKAPKEKVEAEKTKLENYQQQLLELEKLLQELG